MARVSAPPVHADLDAISDYGSDFDDQALTELLTTADSQPLNDIVLTSIEQDPVTEHAVVRLHSSAHILYPRPDHSSPQQVLHAEIEYSSQSKSVHRSENDQARRETSQPVDDGRSPLQRFRTHPKKPLSVTDIVSPAWCEQQYLFSLTKHGRVRRTPAMKQGSAVHKVLEEQVHTTVKIEVESREDSFGLKLWNVISALRMLRSSGIIRELEVWGLLDGQVINGVIDMVTSKCPNTTFEDKMLQRRPSKKQAPALESDQKTLKEFFAVSQHGFEESTQPQSQAMVYILDVKTRQSRTVPAMDGRFKSTQMQLMLYHKLLQHLAAGALEQDKIFQRYGLDSKAVFSDVFIAEIARLDLDTGSSEHKDSMTELLANNNLDLLWQLMVEEYAKTISAEHAHLSDMLTAEFRYAGDGSLLGKRSFTFDKSQVDNYVQDELSWWKGERSTRGVEIEDAFKCRMCEFADDCSWRKNKVEEAAEQARLRKAARTTNKG